MATEYCWRAFAPIIVAAGLLMVPAHAKAAGGAFIVDDAEIGKAGDCKVESWASFASNHDMSAVTSPACVVNAGTPVELGGAIGRFRNDDRWTTNGGPKVKTNLIPVETGHFGVGLAGTAAWNLGTGQYTGNILSIPVTFQVRDDFRININGGWLFDGVARLNYAYWGAGFEWNFVQPLTLIGEIFGLTGPTTDVGSVNDPRAQLGLRLTPVKNTDIDLIYGHNIGGENAHWLTLGLNLHF
jgi:hypothetical protein